MWGDFFLPIIAYGITLLVVTAVAATLHRVRAWRARAPAMGRVIARIEHRPALQTLVGQDDRRAA